jgi:O-antigen ligase
VSTASISLEHSPDIPYVSTWAGWVPVLAATMLLASSPLRDSFAFVLFWAAIFGAMALLNEEWALATMVVAAFLFAPGKPDDGFFSVTDAALICGIGRVVVKNGVAGLFRSDWDSKPLRWFILLLGCCVFSAGYGVHLGGDVKAAVKALFRMIEYTAAFTSLALLLNDGDRAALLKRVLVRMAVVISLFGILQFTLGPSVAGKSFAWGPWWTDTFESSAFRVYSVFPNPIYLSAFLSFFVPLLLAQVFESRRKMRALALLLVIGTCLVLTFSRTGAVGALIGSIYLLGKNFRRLLVISLTVAVLLLSLAPQEFFDRVLERTPDSLVNLYERAMSLQEAVRLIVDHPLTGIGLGQYQVYELKFVRAEVSDQALESITAENTVLQYGAELGLAGLALFAIAMLWAYQQARRLLPRGRIMGRAWTGSMIGLIAANFAASMTAVSIFIFMLIAVLLTKRLADLNCLTAEGLAI